MREVRAHQTFELGAVQQPIHAFGEVGETICTCVRLVPTIALTVNGTFSTTR